MFPSCILCHGRYLEPREFSIKWGTKICPREWKLGLSYKCAKMVRKTLEENAGIGKHSIDWKWEIIAKCQEEQKTRYYFQIYMVKITRSCLTNSLQCRFLWCTLHIEKYYPWRRWLTILLEEASQWPSGCEIWETLDKLMIMSQRHKMSRALVVGWNWG
jgi:hypothetical protein